MSASEMSSGEERSPETQHEDSDAKERLRERAEELKRDVRQVGRTARELAQDALDEALQAGESARDRGLERAGEAEDRLVGYVRAKPIQSLLIAAAAGFVLSSIMRR